MSKRVLQFLLYSICFALPIAQFMSCGAYFNTFYNTKKFFNVAEKKRLDQEKKALVAGTTNKNAKKANIQEYQKAIEKGSRVLQLHPNSKYVDDALMIIGQSFYHTGEFIKARRKFEELITYLPESDFVPQARLWLGRSLIEMNEFSLALDALTELVAQKVDKKLTGEARILLGELYFARKDYPSAIREFTSMIDKVADKSRKIKALQRAAEAHLELEEYDEAAGVFRKALDHNPDLQQRYLVELNYGKTLRKLGDHDQALLLYNGMTKGVLTQDEMAHVRMEIASTFMEMDEREKAEITFEEIAADFPKSDIAVRAHYELGKLYLQKDGDFQRAREQFEIAQKEFNRSTIRDSLKFWIDNGGQWDRLNFERVVYERAHYYYDYSSTDTVGEYTIDESEVFGSNLANLGAFAESRDSTAVSDSLKSQTADDSTFLAQNLMRNLDESEKEEAKDGSNPAGQQNAQSANQQNTKKIIKKVSVPRNLRKLEKKLINTRKQLAELFLFQLELPDSALSNYEYLYANFADNVETPYWMFLCGALHESAGRRNTADSLFRTLVEKYSDTRYAMEARSRLGMQVEEEIETVDEAEKLFVHAEELLFKQNEVDSSAKVYKQIASQYEESDYAAKALHALAWIAEWKLFNNEDALRYYEDLQKRFPNSDYGKDAKKKLANLAAAEKEMKRQAELKLAESSKPDSLTEPKKRLTPEELETMEELEAMDVLDKKELEAFKQSRAKAKSDKPDSTLFIDPRKRKPRPKPND